ncbi:MAG: hypothetical protein IH945_01860 [Armatimonadetes bacterium]|nr:hypothetical protein [Armatimonadota bacterium]
MLSRLQIAVLLLLAMFAGCRSPSTEARKELAASSSEIERFYHLGSAAIEHLDEGNIEDARNLANELAALTPKFPNDWNYGNAIQDSNQVLGRIALIEGRVDDAKEYLLKSGDTPGSPQLNSFGPNMTLAKELLDEGETKVVLEYFDLCRNFWDMHSDDLNKWERQVKAGKTPDWYMRLD